MEFQTKCHAVIPADYVADWVKELSKHSFATSEL